MPPKKSAQRKLLIAIDGGAGSGKSSTAKAFAKKLKLPYIDTGAMYRAVTLKATQLGVDWSDKKTLAKIARDSEIRLEGSNPLKIKVFLDGKNVSKAIRNPELTRNVFHVAQEPLVRAEMVKKQRQMGKKAGGVMEGRDIGTVVFPDADFKFFFEASVDVRAERRQKELAESGTQISLKQVKKDLIRRDKTDTERKVGALKLAKGAVYMDTSSLTIEATLDKMLQLIRPKPLKGRNLTAKASGE